MTTSGIQAQHDRAMSSAGVGWQWVRTTLGVLSAGIGIYQITVGHLVGAAFSFCMAATFLLSVAFERTVSRARQDGIAVPGSVLILVCCTGIAIGATLVLGVFLVTGSP
jgi:hypothetical protein